VLAGALVLLGAGVWPHAARAELFATYTYDVPSGGPVTPPWLPVSGALSVPQYDPSLNGGQPLAWMEVELSATLTGSVYFANQNSEPVTITWSLTPTVNFELDGTPSSVITSVDPTANGVLNLTASPGAGSSASPSLNVTEATTYYAWAGNPLLTTFTGAGNVPVSLISLYTAGTDFVFVQTPLGKTPPIFSDSPLLTATVTVRYFVPEPGTLALAGLVAAGALLRRRRRG
jgi:hypothetical protein